MGRLLRPTLVVGIGGSAGALNAYKALLDALPSDTGMAFVIISHMNPDANSYLAEILVKHTNMQVTVASDAMPIRKDHIYVIPPNADLFIENYTFRVVSPRTIRNKQIDFLFTSLAKAMGAQAVGIIVSGYGGDGTDGCKHIKAKGGTTFAQDPSAEVKDMPVHAIKSGHIDFVLSFDKISEKLQKLAAASQQVRPSQVSAKLS